MKVKTSQATPVQIDYLVARILGVNLEAFRMHYGNPDKHGELEFHYSSAWSQGGPIIEREKIVTAFEYGSGFWQAYMQGEGGLFHGPTPLIAAMRCYVASKLGDEVEIPEELA